MTYDDDKIDFQWGERYITLDHIVENVGGKYWKYNPDGSITEFKPSQLRMKGAARAMFDSGFNFEIKSYYDKMKFSSRRQAKRAEFFINDDGYYLSKGIKAEVKGKILKLIATNDEALKVTYFPGNN